MVHLQWSGADPPPTPHQSHRNSHALSHLGDNDV